MDASNWNFNDNFAATESSVLERTNSPERGDYFEKHKDVRIEPKQQQTEEAQPMDTAVNELHQISQMYSKIFCLKLYSYHFYRMNFPCGAYPYSAVDCVSIAHIPLPPSPKSDLHTAFDCNVSTANASSDPFTEVDQLAQLAQMMHE